MDDFWIKSMIFCSPTCHQRADRSFFIKNKQMPICARCFGLYLGYFIGIIYMIFSYLMSSYMPLYLSLILILPLAIDGGIQYISKYESINSRRFLTGILAGFGIINLLGVLILIILGEL